MISNMKSLIGKLNKTTKKALEQSAEFCVSQQNFSVEIEHFLYKLIESDENDIQLILRHFEMNTPLIKRQLMTTIEGFKRGANRTPSLSPHLLSLIEQAWILSSIELTEAQVRSATILQGLLSHDELRAILYQHCPALMHLSKAKLDEALKDIIKASPETVEGFSNAPYGSQMAGAPNTENSKDDGALNHYTVDLTAQARAGKIDPIEGRENEIRQMIDILTRRRQNNPILTGDAGVGKTAIVEGLAQKVADGDVPPALKNVVIRTLDMGLLEAGAGIKGEFENRLKSVIQEVQGALNPIILFIDEAHTIIGSGGNEGQNDAANLLKPALARGELKTIAATTWDEYKKYFEKDPALTRRFQVVKVGEPSESATINMVRSLTPKLEKFHQASILNEALAAAVKLSHRYIQARKLPDKAISVLDTACARVAVAQNATPVAIENLTRSLSLLASEKKLLEREQLEGIQHKERLDEIEYLIKEQEKEHQALEKQWKEELSLVKEVLEAQRELWSHVENEGTDHKQTKEKQKQVQTLKEKVRQLTEKDTLVPLCVTEEVIADVIASWTGIPVGKMMKDEVKTLLELPKIMGERLIGQKQAINTIAESIRAYRAQLSEPGKPVGVFLLAGPSGVGKTETALTLADTLYGGERHLITINMSEYQEAYTVSSLRGSPPGYVGHGKGGVLTEAVRRNPYSVILLDEVEKAHPDVMELFYQTFDRGMMEDGEGIEVDFKNTIILMTSNLGTEQIVKLCQEKAEPTVEMMNQEIFPILKQHFATAFLARMTLAPYVPLDPDEIKQIIHLKLDKIKKRYETQHNTTFSYDEKLVSLIEEKCIQTETGARAIDFVVNQKIMPLLSSEILKRVAEEKPLAHLSLSVDKNNQLHCHFSDKKAA